MKTLLHSKISAKENINYNFFTLQKEILAPNQLW